MQSSKRWIIKIHDTSFVKELSFIITQKTGCHVFIYEIRGTTKLKQNMEYYNGNWNLRFPNTAYMHKLWTFFWRLFTMPSLLYLFFVYFWFYCCCFKLAIVFHVYFHWVQSKHKILLYKHTRTCFYKQQQSILEGD